MAMHFVQIVSMNKTVRIGGVIQIMEHFSVRINIVFMKHGFVMVPMIVVIIPMKFIVLLVFRVG
jgi:hypothetical protein